VLGQQLAGEGDVVPGILGLRLGEDGVGGDAAVDGDLAEVDGLASGEAFHGGGGVSAGEDDEREQAPVVEVGGVGGDVGVVAAEADGD
jgi:hypothetical protein